MRLLLSSLAMATVSLAATTFSVRDYGAVGDGTTLDTLALQRAIDACAEAGGGSVLLPEGRYLSGSLALKSKVTLSIAPKATLLGSRNIADFRGPLVGATDATGITIEGGGTIDGQGEAYWVKQREYNGPAWRGTVQHEYKALKRPTFVRLTRCQDVIVRDITLTGSPSWTLHLLRCQRARVENVTIRNPLYGPNTDGIDINSCIDVTVKGCDIITGDDGIVLKSTEPGHDHPSRNITVSDCRIWSACNALKIGTETHDDFTGIAMRDCHLYSTTENLRERPISGIAIESVDGAHLRDIRAENITMSGVRTPIFVRLGHRGGNSQRTQQVEPRVPGTIDGVILRNIKAEKATFPSSITGIPEHPVRNITLEDIDLVYEGGGEAGLVNDDIPDETVIRRYPEATMFGPLPAYGLYCRHAQDVTLRNVAMHCETPDARPLLVCSDVQRLLIDRLSTPAAPTGFPLLWFLNASAIQLLKCHAPEGTDTFVALEGSGRQAITMQQCDTSPAKTPLALLDPGALLLRNTPLLRETKPGLVLVRASDLRLTPPMRLTDQRTVEVPVGQGRDWGAARCRFTVSQSGEYVARVNVCAPSAEANSFYLAIDRGHASLSDVFRYGEWIWDEVRDRIDGKANPDSQAVFHLEAGEHSLVLRNRESGTRIRAIAITRKDLPFDPSALQK